MKHIRHLKNKTFVLLALIVFDQSCSCPEKIGYVNNSSENLTPRKHANLAASDCFTILRDPFNNSFDIRVSEKEYFYARNSMDIDAYEILLTGTIDNKLVWKEKVKFICPSLYSSNIRIDKIWTEEGGSKIHILLTTDELGKDLVLSSLVSPPGIKGIFEFGDAEYFVPFRANLIGREDPSLEIYKCKRLFHRYLLVKSIVEYPVDLTIGFPGTDKENSRPITRLIKPWQKTLFKLPSSVKASPNGFTFHQDFVYNSPIQFNRFPFKIKIKFL